MECAGLLLPDVARDHRAAITVNQEIKSQFVEEAEFRMPITRAWRFRSTPVFNPDSASVRVFFNVLRRTVQGYCGIPSRVLRYEKTESVVVIGLLMNCSIYFFLSSMENPLLAASWRKVLMNLDVAILPADRPWARVRRWLRAGIPIQRR